MNAIIPWDHFPCSPFYSRLEDKFTRPFDIVTRIHTYIYLGMDGWMDRESRSLPFTRLIMRYGRKRERERWRKMMKVELSVPFLLDPASSCGFELTLSSIGLCGRERIHRDLPKRGNEGEGGKREERGQELQSTWSCLDPGSIDSICWSRRDGKGIYTCRLFLLMPAAEFASLSVSLPSISFMFCVSSDYFDNILNHPPL